MMSTELSLLRFAIGIDQNEPQVEQHDWDAFFNFCQKHAILGLGFGAVEKISPEKRPSKGVTLKWFSYVDRIEQRNKLLNERCKDIVKLFEDNGFHSCILKGQGNAAMYPQPLRRQSGDIDVWVGGRIRDVVSYIQRTTSPQQIEITYHHTDFPIWENVEVEVHYRPMWLNSPWRNYRLQNWFRQQAPEQFAHMDEKLGFSVPTPVFNMVYQLLHVFHHLLEEGVGYRQILDYYYLLQHCQESERQSAMEVINYLGLKRIAGALMYVLGEAFSLPTDKMLSVPDTKAGKDLLSEITLSGNFGKSDLRNEKLMKKSGLCRKLMQSRRLVQMVALYPEETLCAPFRFSHVLWRKMNLWKYE
jgi:hypothetical protein